MMGGGGELDKSFCIDTKTWQDHYYAIAVVQGGHHHHPRNCGAKAFEAPMR